MQVLRYAEYSIIAVLLLIGAGIWRFARAKSRSAPAPAGLRLIVAGWIILFLSAWSPLATAMMGVLEWQAGERRARPEQVQAVVVLSGGVYAAMPPEPAVVPGFGTYSRCRHAAWLHNHGWRMPVVVTGGASPEGFNYADVMADTLEKEGVPKDLVWREREARSTAENALYTARLLHPKGIRKILLVTEAYHMPRAMSVFSKAGFEVYAAPCFYRTREFRGRWDEWLLPQPRSIRMLEDALHEMVGLAVYRLKGLG